MEKQQNEMEKRKIKTINCKTCNKAEEATTGLKIYCNDCSRLRHNQDVYKWRRNNKEKVREMQNDLSKREWKMGIKRKEEWRKNNPEKSKAQSLVQNRGLEYGPCCVHCGTTERLQRHHPDYSKPLETITLCVLCHNRLHKNLIVLEVN